MSNDTIAGSGLEKMFYGQILSILVIIPLVGWIAAIVGIVLFLVGLHEAAGADEGYRTAFYVEIGILVLSVLAVFYRGAEYSHFDSESGGDLPGLYYHCRPA